MKRLVGRVASVLLGASLFAMLAGPALAVSSITNYMSISNTGACRGQTVNITTETDFNQFAIPTIYTSDYAVAINYIYFSSTPTITSSLNENSYFVYRSSEGSIYGEPAWWYQTNPIWVFQPVWHKLYMSATVTRHDRSSGWNFHGQAFPGNSYGTPVRVQMWSSC